MEMGDLSCILKDKLGRKIGGGTEMGRLYLLNGRENNYLDKKGPIYAATPKLIWDEDLSHHWYNDHSI